MSSNFKKKDFVIFSFLVLVFSVLLLIVPIYNLNHTNTNLFAEVKGDKINTLKIESVISEISNNKEIVSKNIIDRQYTNVLLRSSNNDNLIYESYIYNKDGVEISFEELIKENKVNDFWNKVYELLAMKYPEFIVNGIKNSSGNNAYELKENAMIIYFMNYLIEPQITELITLKVNYNEIKDYIDFSCKLDELYTNEDGFNFSKNKKAVALTFDDGPSNEKTKKILDILNKNKAHATFFMVGEKMSKDSTTVKAVYDSGNEIGSHTYAHANLTRQTAEERQQALSMTDSIFNTITGDNITLLRPPYGAYKREMLTEFNYSVVLWNIDTEDWRYKNTDRIIDTVLTNLTDGSVILMHDSYNTTVEAVEKLLPILYAKGYQVVSVSELAKLKDISLEKNHSYRKFK